MLKIVNNKNSTSYLNAPEHQQFSEISSHAIKVIERLQKAKYDAYLVGGAVRDMMLNQTPKDFDVATNATPENIRKLFKNSRIIGRRFQIVHIRFGREIIEVTTFRGSHNNPSAVKSAKTSAVSAEGMLTRDNVFGSMEEDAERRDFTVNALYYDPQQAKIYDFCDGLQDLESKTLRLIGEPDTRFKEDPVRILRAIRFSVKLGFDIAPDIIDGFNPNAPLLRKVSAARLFDESLKLYISGHALATFQMLKKHDILGYLLFNHDVFESGSTALKLAEQAMINTDERLKQNKSVTPAFLYAVFLWPSLLTGMKQLETESMPEFTVLHIAAAEIFTRQSLFTTIPKRFQSVIREIWELQFRLPNNQGRKAYKIFEYPRFRAGYDFLLLREQAGEIESGLGEWWTEFQENQPADSQLHPRKTQSGNLLHKPRKRKPTHKNTPPRE